MHFEEVSPKKLELLTPFWKWEEPIRTAFAYLDDQGEVLSCLRIFDRVLRLSPGKHFMIEVAGIGGLFTVEAYRKNKGAEALIRKVLIIMDSRGYGGVVANSISKGSVFTKCGFLPIKQSQHRPATQSLYFHSFSCELRQCDNWELIPGNHF